VEAIYQENSVRLNAVCATAAFWELWTNTLELGIDVGSLDACVMAGYPGSIASTWQRAGRAGRRSGTSCAVFVASSAPLDQFIVQHPDYFFGSFPEHAHIQPDNLEILVNHLKCAAFELPISPDERFGNVDVQELCEQLGEAGFLHQSGGNWHWIDEAYPADTISLRSVTSDNFVIIDTTGEENGKPEVIGEVRAGPNCAKWIFVLRVTNCADSNKILKPVLDGRDWHANEKRLCSFSADDDTLPLSWMERSSSMGKGASMNWNAKCRGAH
jgi:ATP-dependent helicase YprA (DUF1998 family)